MISHQAWIGACCSAHGVPLSMERRSATEPALHVGTGQKLRAIIRSAGARGVPVVSNSSVHGACAASVVLPVKDASQVPSRFKLVKVLRFRSPARLVQPRSVARLGAGEGPDLSDDHR
jgi:hypothetical protein